MLAQRPKAVGDMVYKPLARSFLGMVVQIFKGLSVTCDCDQTGCFVMTFYYFVLNIIIVIIIVCTVYIFCYEFLLYYDK